MTTTFFLWLQNIKLYVSSDLPKSVFQDYSEFPALCRPIREGGFGFDYRSAANVSELWQKVRGLAVSLLTNCQLINIILIARVVQVLVERNCTRVQLIHKTRELWSMYFRFYTEDRKITFFERENEFR